MQELRHARCLYHRLLSAGRDFGLAAQVRTGTLTI
jgi:hypothetical protein